MEYYLPVSYTHLDVYKRQPPYGAIITHDDIADDNSIVGQEAVFTKNRVNVVKRTNDSHMQVKSEK